VIVSDTIPVGKNTLDTGITDAYHTGRFFMDELEARMPLASAKKQELIEKFKAHDTDTGSADVQIALLTERIRYLTEHFKTNKKDHHSRRGLLKLVGRRRRLLDYVKASDQDRYQNLIAELGIRK